MKPIAIFAVLAMSAGLSGCLACGFTGACPAPSPAFQQVEGLAWRERDAKLAQMSIDQRLDVYHDVYIRSGHPRMMLTQAFEGTGATGFDAVLARMTDEASFIEHFWIIHTMGLRSEIDVCDPRFFSPLSDKVGRFATPDPKHPVPIRFDRCELVL